MCYGKVKIFNGISTQGKCSRGVCCKCYLYVSIKLFISEKTIHTSSNGSNGAKAMAFFALFIKAKCYQRRYPEGAALQQRN